MNNLTRRDALGAFATLGLTGMLAACGSSGDKGADAATSASGSAATSASASAPAEDVVVRVAALKGPTAIGLCQMMDTTSGIPAEGDDITGATAEPGSGVTYAYSISSAPDEVLPKVIKGDVDIALVPANAAAVLYNKTEAGVRAIDVNTLGVLSVVTGDASVKEWGDLAGRTVNLAGKGSSNEYAVNYLLDQAGILADVTLEWKSEHAEVAAVLADDPNAIGILPQPFTTVTMAQNDALSAPIDLNDVWDEYAGATGSQFVMGVTVVRAAFADEHPEAVADFLSRHQTSADEANADPAAVAPLVVEAGIIPKEPIAQKAIPKCSVVCIQGDEMKDALKGYLEVLCSQNPESVGGTLPGDDFYYEA